MTTKHTPYAATLPRGIGYHVGNDFNRAVEDHPVTVVRVQGQLAIFAFNDGFKPRYGAGHEAYTRLDLLWATEEA